jgi:hypothetical protein
MSKPSRKLKMQLSTFMDDAAYIHSLCRFGTIKTGVIIASTIKKLATLPRRRSSLLPLLAALAGVLLCTSTALAQNGCDQFSPENPTLVLGLIGAGVASFPVVRSRLKRYIRQTRR